MTKPGYCTLYFLVIAFALMGTPASASRELVPQPTRFIGDVDRHLATILESASFKKAPTVRALLVYLWQHQGESISEYAIATEALGRRPDFDTKADATVRVHVARLRQKLKEFYDTGGQSCPLIISIPLGGHALDVRLAPDAVVEEVVPPKEPDYAPANPWNRRSRMLGVCVIIFGIACAAQFVQNRGLSAALLRKNAPPHRFWKAFVSNGKPTRLFLPTPVFFE